MNLVTLMYKYINRFINSDELLESLEELDLNNFSKEEKISINKLIDDIKTIKDKTANEIDEIEKNRLETIERIVSDINIILDSDNLEKDLREKIEHRKEYLLEDKKKVKDGGKLYESIYILLADNKLINHYWDLMNDYELLEFIAQYISVPIPPQIDQEKFNDLVKVGIKNNEREWLWRLAFNYNEKNKDFSLIEDYFIEKRDDYYLTELISAVREDLDMKKLKEKVLATNDKKFITSVKKTLKDYEGKVKVISVVPSLDTGVCDAQTRWFNQDATGLSDDVVVLTISMDLPFAQKRWCGAAGVDKVETLSDHKDASFGTNYGFLIEELRLLSRGVVVINKDNKVTYVEYVPEVTQAVNFDAALEAIKADI